MTITVPPITVPPITVPPITVPPITRTVLEGRRVLVPGGTGAVGEGIVRACLGAGAEVVVPTRSAERQAEFRAVLGTAADNHLHLPRHDYTTFAGADALAATTVKMRGGIDHVVAPIGGWWAGKQLWGIDQHDWDSAFVELATTHMAMARAVLPRLSSGGTYTVVVGQSAAWPVPSSGLVSMEQAAVLMMHRVLAAEVGDGLRMFALVLGPVRTRAVAGRAGWVSADEVGQVAVSLAAHGPRRSAEIALANSAQAQRVLSDHAASTA